MAITGHLPTPPHRLVLAFRAIQLLSAFVSMILYAVFIARVAAGSAGADRAVVGIAAAAVVWAISALVQQVWKRKHRSNSGDAGESDKTGSPPSHSKRKKVAIAVLMFVILDVIFVGLMIASAAISGRRQACAVPEMDDDDNDGSDNGSSMMGGYNGRQCGLQKGVLALSIVNVFSFGGSGIMELMHGMHMPPNPMDAHNNARSLFQELF